MYEYKAVIYNVVDGDTFDAKVDLGYYVTLDLRFRVLDIDCPETFGEEREEGEKVSTYVRGLLEGNEVTIQSEKSDSFGRWLAHVDIDGIDLADHLLEKGYAVVYKP